MAKHRNTLLISSALSKKPDADSHNSQQSPSELLLLVDKFVRGEPLIGSATEDFSLISFVASIFGRLTGFLALFVRCLTTYLANEANASPLSG